MQIRALENLVGQISPISGAGRLLVGTAISLSVTVAVRLLRPARSQRITMLGNEELDHILHQHPGFRLVEMRQVVAARPQ